MGVSTSGSTNIGYLGTNADVSMGNQGPTVSGATPSVAGPAIAARESKGTTARTVGMLTPFSQAGATPVGIVDDDAFGNNENNVAMGTGGTVRQLTPFSQVGSTMPKPR